MRQTRDTFTHFLADNLASKSIPVHQIRLDALDPSSALIQPNAVNLDFSNADFSSRLSGMVVDIDVVHGSELTALDWTQAVINLLFSSTMTPKLDYTDPAHPVPTGTNIYWSPRVIFRPITDGNFARFSATVVISHYNYRT